VTAPWLMRTLSVVGTAAMFLVGGGIVSHELPVVHHFVEEVRHAIEAQTGEGLLLSVGGLFVEATVGITVGLIVVGFVAAGQAAVRLVRQRPA
jgi:predicted DNA repair protein MutK